MTILVTCGIHDEWCTFAQGRLESMGFNAPVASSRSHMSASELTEKMLSVSRPGGKTSYKSPAPKLGQAWHIAAADLMIANADQESWGWAHQGEEERGRKMPPPGPSEAIKSNPGAKL